MKSRISKEIKLLKSILWIYIILCIIIAGLNYGYAGNASKPVAEFITWFWHFYENWIKTLFIIICSFLTLKIVSSSKRTKMRKRNLIGFISAALIVHIFTPILLNNKELYFFTMPLPWTTTPLQLLEPNSSFYLSRLPVWGASGISLALYFYIIYALMILVGTLLFGRRWQCSTICLFNGFASEVFAPAIPLVGKSNKMTPPKLKLFIVLKWIFLILGVFFTIWWGMHIFGLSLMGGIEVMSKIENYKYLTTELLMAMFFWIAFIGRGYCYYCPLGTVLGLLSKISRQRIKTNNTKCIECNQCNLSCPMAIDIKTLAKDGLDVVELRCVGCGHCVDICPTETLSYSTSLIDAINKRNIISSEDSK